MTDRARQAARLALAALAAFVAATWLQGGWLLAYSTTSPDGRYRIDLYHGPRWQRLLHPGLEDPGFAQVSRTVRTRPLATSGVIDLRDAPTTWLDDGALVADTLRFRVATGRWERADRPS